MGTVVHTTTWEVYKALLNYEWPSPSGTAAFGITSEKHFEALLWAVHSDGVTLGQLQKARGDSEAVQALISPTNPHRDVEFSISRNCLAKAEGQHFVRHRKPGRDIDF